MIRTDGDRAEMVCKRLPPTAGVRWTLEHPAQRKIDYPAYSELNLVPRGRSLFSFFLSHMVSA